MLIDILGKIVGIIALVLGIRSGYRWWSNAEEKTIRIGTHASNMNDSFVTLFIYCVIGFFVWGIPMALPLLIIKKIGWIPVLIVGAIIIGICVLGKKD